MQVIRDGEMGGLAMIPLLVDWRIPKQCQVLDNGKRCEEKTTTIVSLTAEEARLENPVTFGMCDKHHAVCAQTGRLNLEIAQPALGEA